MMAMEREIEFIALSDTESFNPVAHHGPEFAALHDAMVAKGITPRRSQQAIDGDIHGQIYDLPTGHRVIMGQTTGWSPGGGRHAGGGLSYYGQTTFSDPFISLRAPKGANDWHHGQEIRELRGDRKATIAAIHKILGQGA